MHSVYTEKFHTNLIRTNLSVCILYIPVFQTSRTSHLKGSDYIVKCFSHKSWGDQVIHYIGMCD